MEEIKHKEIIRAKVHLQKENPFFSFLVMNLNPIESKDIKSIGVDIQGNLYYNKKWVDDLTQEQLKGVLTHEVLHLALEHFLRDTDKHQEIYNIACDLVINDILINNNFQLPKGLVPYNHKFTFKEDKIIIEDLDKKSADEVYNELMKYADKEKQDKNTIVGFDSERFDNHEIARDSNGKGKDRKGKDKKEQGISREELKQIKDKWKKLLGEASAYAKQQGNMPSGMERLVDIMLNDKINWKSLLYKYITRELPFDYSYNRPSKRSRALGIYMPSVKRESINIAISVDTSSSISQKELSEFLGEIVSIAKSFNNINMTLIICDNEIKDVYEVRNGNIQTILDLKIHGGGGTSFTTPLNYIKDNLPNTKFTIFFTDGYGDRISLGDYNFNIIWLLTKGGTDNYIKDSGEIINLE